MFACKGKCPLITNAKTQSYYTERKLHSAIIAPKEYYCTNTEAKLSSATLAKQTSLRRGSHQNILGVEVKPNLGKSNKFVNQTAAHSKYGRIHQVSRICMFGLIHTQHRASGHWSLRTILTNNATSQEFFHPQVADMQARETLPASATRTSAYSLIDTQSCAPDKIDNFQ